MQCGLHPAAERHPVLPTRVATSDTARRGRPAKPHRPLLGTPCACSAGPPQRRRGADGLFLPCGAAALASAAAIVALPNNKASGEGHRSAARFRPRHGVSRHPRRRRRLVRATWHARRDRASGLARRRQTRPRRRLGVGQRASIIGDYRSLRIEKPLKATVVLRCPCFTLSLSPCLQRGAITIPSRDLKTQRCAFQIEHIRTCSTNQPPAGSGRLYPVKVNIEAALVAAIAIMPNDKIIVVTACLVVLLVVFRLCWKEPPH